MFCIFVFYVVKKFEFFLDNILHMTIDMMVNVSFFAIIIWNLAIQKTS